MQKKLTLLVLLTTLSYGLFAQTKITIKGTVFGDDTMQPLPFTNIIIDSTGTTSNLYGDFALQVAKSDTLHFSYIGYKRKTYIIPDSVNSTTINIEIILFKDITFLKPITITPLPATLSDLKDKVLATKVPISEELENAKKSIDLATYQYLYMRSFKLKMSAYDNYAMFLKGNEGLNPAGGNVKGFIKFLKNRVEGKPLEGTYQHYLYYQKNKGQ